MLKIETGADRIRQLESKDFAGNFQEIFERAHLPV